jgi:hypothetical protein
MPDIPFKTNLDRLRMVVEGRNVRMGYERNKTKQWLMLLKVVDEFLRAQHAHFYSYVCLGFFIIEDLKDNTSKNLIYRIMSKVRAK